MHVTKTIFGMYISVILRFGSFWIGCHYSSKYSAYCIAFIPCVIIRIAPTPYEHDQGYFERKLNAQV